MEEEQNEQKLTDEELQRIVDSFDNVIPDYITPKTEYFHIFEKHFLHTSKCECCLKKSKIRYAGSITVEANNPKDAIGKYARKYIIAIHCKDLDKEENAEYLKALEEQEDVDGDII